MGARRPGDSQKYRRGTIMLTGYGGRILVQKPGHVGTLPTFIDFSMFPLDQLEMV